MTTIVHDQTALPLLRSIDFITKQEDYMADKMWKIKMFTTSIILNWILSKYKK